MPASRPRPCASVVLALLLAGEVATLLALVRLGRRPPFDLGPALRDWAQATPVDAIAAASRWVAIAAAGWLVLVTACAAASLGIARSARRARAWHRHLAFVAPRPIRTWVERASARAVGAVVASTAALTTQLAPATAATSTPPAVTIVRDGRTGRLASLPTASTDAPNDAPADAPRTAPGAEPLPSPHVDPEPGRPPSSAVHVVVVSGDNLWELAAREIARASARGRRDVADVEIAPYWVAVCNANRDHLASGDVNLVFPGEVVELPPLG